VKDQRSRPEGVTRTSCRRWSNGRTAAAWTLTVIEVNAARDVRRAAARPVPMPGCRWCGWRGFAERFTLRNGSTIAPAARRATAGAGNRRRARLHHPPHPQFLRILQTACAHCNRHLVHVPWPGGRGRPAHPLARLEGNDLLYRDRTSERNQGDCQSNRRKQAPGRRRHMKRHWRLKSAPRMGRPKWHAHSCDRGIHAF